MARDEFLDDLGRKLNQAKKHRDTCKEIRDLAKKELDSFRPRFTETSNDIANAKEQKEYYSAQAYHARREKSSMASHYASEARSYGERLKSLYNYQNQLKADQRTARDGHERAKADLNAAYNELNRLQKAFNDRLAELQAQNQRASSYHAEEQRRIRDIQGATSRPQGTLEAGNAFVNGHPAYYEKGNRGNLKRMDLFEGGVPRAHHKDIPHPHIVTEGDDLKHMREKDGTILADE